MNKKDIPLSIHQAIEPLLLIIKDKQLVVDKSGSIFKVKDSELGSEFFFEISQYEIREGKMLIGIKHKPQNTNDISSNHLSIWLDSLGKQFNQWILLLDGYKKVKTIYDDPILEKYEAEFYSKLESADEDANISSFSLEQQIYLDEAIGKVITLLEAKKDENNEAAITSIIEQAEEIQATITESTKQETLSKLSTLFAKVQKVGLKFIKEIYPVIQKEIISQIVKSTLHLPSITDLL